MLREIMREAVRLDRSLSWTMQQAWRLAREEVRRFPAMDHRGRTEPTRPSALDVRRAEAPPRTPSAQVLEFLRGKFDRELTG